MNIKRKPTKLKVIRGTAQKCRILPNEVQVIPLNEIPPPPEHLKEDGKKEWNIVCEHLKSVGLLALTDLTSLTSYCYAVDLCRQAERMLNEQPKVGTQKNRAGEVYQFANKWFQIWNESTRRMQGLAGEFGLTPSARTRISMPKKISNEEDKQMFGT